MCGPGPVCGRGRWGAPSAPNPTANPALVLNRGRRRIRSPTQRTNLDQLEEVVSLQAELMDLRGDAGGPAEGIVIESRVEKGRGYAVPPPVWPAALPSWRADRA